MADNDERLSQRLLARQGGLTRRVMPDGKHAFSGPTASRALKALGARAFTMDREIFVPEQFDPSSNSKDLALYAHEAHHRDGSGGMHDDHGNDVHGHSDEEQEARNIERRVAFEFQKGRGKSAGDVLREVGRDGMSGVEAADMNLDEDVSTNDAGGRPNPTEAYKRLRRMGMSHDRIIDDLSEDVIRSMKRHQQSISDRTMENG